MEMDCRKKKRTKAVVKLCDTTHVSTTKNISDSFHALFFIHFWSLCTRNLFFFLLFSMLSWTLYCFMTMYGIITHCLRSCTVEDSMILKNWNTITCKEFYLTILCLASLYFMIESWWLFCVGLLWNSS